MTDRQLLDRFVTVNDPDAFRGLIDRHGPMVFAVCRSVLRTQHDVEDAFQNTFLALARRAGTINRLDTIGPWLHRVAVRMAHKARRKISRDRAFERTQAHHRPEPYLYPRDLSSIPLLREEVNRLPENYRLAVVLCYLDGKTQEEAANQLRCPVGTIKCRLSRARQTLRDSLEPPRRGPLKEAKCLCTILGGEPLGEPSASVNGPLPPCGGGDQKCGSRHDNPDALGFSCHILNRFPYRITLLLSPERPGSSGDGSVPEYVARFPVAFVSESRPLSGGDSFGPVRRV